MPRPLAFAGTFDRRLSLWIPRQSVGRFACLPILQCRMIASGGRTKLRELFRIADVWRLLDITLFVVCKASFRRSWTIFCDAHLIFSLSTLTQNRFWQPSRKRQGLSSACKHADKQCLDSMVWGGLMRFYIVLLQNVLVPYPHCGMLTATEISTVQYCYKMSSVTDLGVGICSFDCLKYLRTTVLLQMVYQIAIGSCCVYCAIWGILMSMQYGLQSIL